MKLLPEMTGPNVLLGTLISLCSLLIYLYCQLFIYFYFLRASLRVDFTIWILAFSTTPTTTITTMIATITATTTTAHDEALV